MTVLISDAVLGATLTAIEFQLSASPSKAPRAQRRSRSLRPLGGLDLNFHPDPLIRQSHDDGLSNGTKTFE